MAELEELLSAAQAAAAAGDWVSARSASEAVLAREERPEALLGLGEACWWLGDTAGSVAATERAFSSFRRRDDAAGAALAACSLYFVYRVSLGNLAASRGWFRRFASLVEDHGLEPFTGWVVLVRAHDTDDAAASEAWARQALDLARAGPDLDLELCAKSQIGAALVAQGRVEEGTAMLDEAMAASLAGECDRLDTVVYTSCSLVTACAQVAEFERVIQWVSAADRFASRYGCPHLHTVCRTYCGAALAATGRWDRAEEELEAAVRLGAKAEPAVAGEAVSHLAGLRFAQGRIEEAERLVAGYGDHAATAAVIAALHLARGRPGAAALVLRRRLSDLEAAALVSGVTMGAGAVIEHARLLELVVQTELARDEAEAAAAAAAQVSSVAAAGRSPVARALAARARGRVLLAGGDRTGAIAALEEAVAGFGRLGQPAEAAHARVLLAEALFPVERDAAVAEARSALATFERLGATTGADHAAALLRSAGERVSRAGPRLLGALSRREAEVFTLLAEGMSNRQIAQRLYVTTKTVENHVSSIFTKLGLASRAEAAALAARSGG